MGGPEKNGTGPQMCWELGSWIKRYKTGRPVGEFNKSLLFGRSCHMNNIWNFPNSGIRNPTALYPNHEKLQKQLQHEFWNISRTKYRRNPEDFCSLRCLVWWFYFSQPQTKKVRNWIFPVAYINFFPVLPLWVSLWLKNPNSVLLRPLMMPGHWKKRVLRTGFNTYTHNKW